MVVNKAIAEESAGAWEEGGEEGTATLLPTTPDSTPGNMGDRHETHPRLGSAAF
jgi:hypothetical protein